MPIQLLASSQGAYIGEQWSCRKIVQYVRG